MSLPIKVNFLFVNCVNCPNTFLLVLLAGLPGSMCCAVLLVKIAFFHILCRSLSSLKHIEIGLQKNQIRSFSIYKNWGWLSFSKRMRLSSIFKHLRLSSNVKIWSRLPKISSMRCLEQNLGRLSFEKNEVVFILKKILRSSIVGSN